MSQATYVSQNGVPIVLDAVHPKTNGYHVGVAGNICIRRPGGDVIYKGVQAGQFLPYAGTMILSAGTTATDIIAEY